MENKINIAELLKDCPQGMELDCTMYEDVYFDCVDELNIIHCYIQNEGLRTSITFNQYGTPNSDIKSKCVIFPKGKTTWEGFVPFVKGDIIYTDGFVAILFDIEESGTLWYYCYYSISEDRCKIKTDFGIGNVKDNELRYATEEEKQKLFDVIKENGYKWNPETKTLEKLIEPKFKVGNQIRHKTHTRRGNVVTEIKDTHYILDDELALPFTSQDEYELVPNKFDITTLIPFESKVLVRDRNNDEWRGQFFSHCNNCSDRPYICIGVEGLCEFKQCVPFESNEHLLGTADDCDEFYKIWK